MYGLAPEKLLRLVYGPFYLAISLTWYKTVKIDGLVKNWFMPLARAEMRDCPYGNYLSELQKQIQDSR